MTNIETTDEMIPNGWWIMIIYFTWDESKINEFLLTKSEDFYQKWIDYIIKSHQIFQLKYEHSISSNFAIIIKHPSSYWQLKELRDDISYEWSLPSDISIDTVTVMSENASESWNSSIFSWFFG